MQRYSRSWPVARYTVFDALARVKRRPKTGGVTVTHLQRDTMKFHVKLPYPRSGPPPTQDAIRRDIKLALSDAPTYFQIAYRKRWIAVWFTVTERRWLTPVTNKDLFS